MRHVIVVALIVATAIIVAIPVFCGRAQVKEKEEAFDTSIKISDMMKTLKIAYGDSLSDYEARYNSYIFRDFSLQYGIKWTAFPSMVWIETGWKTNLVSPKGAKGITQTMDDTRAAECDTLGILFRRKETHWRDIDAMVIGVNYLSRHIRINDSTVDYKNGFGTYVAGPGWMNKRDPDTRKYIRWYQKTTLNEMKKLDYIYKYVVSEE